jgi:hypothetical protein
MKKTIDVTLERDAAYVEATERLLALTVELSNLEKQRNEIESGIASLASQRLQTIHDQAAAMLSGATVPDPQKREALTRSLEEMTHRIAVLREAVSMQRSIVANERSRVSREICADLAPRHAANVAAVARAAVALAEAVAAEAALRRELSDNGVEFAGHLRAMPIKGFLIAEDYSTVSRYLLECSEFGFLAADELPAVVRKRIPTTASRAGIVQAATVKAGDWLSMD